MHHEPFVKLTPVYKDYLWGGNKLKALYGAALSRVAEAWLLSVHPDGPSTIAQGAYAGRPLAEYLQESGQSGTLPLLIKMIDSAKKLSVQVHPDDAYARIHENDQGKSEMWIVLESEPGAYLYVGFRRDVTKAEIRERVEAGTIEDILHKLPTHAGDMIYIPAGTVHAIGEGNLILEIQQSSNATYRLYDYQRRDDQGRLRPLHLAKALEVIDCRKYEDAAPANTAQSVQYKYFAVAQQTIHGQTTLPLADGAFASIVCVQGEGSLRRGGKTTTLRRGDSLYLPPSGGPATAAGDLQIVITQPNA